MRIYLAGPEVFFANATTQARQLKDICRKLGLIGCFPTDSGPHTGATKHEIGKNIYLGNVKLIDNCDAVIANMMPFRSPSMDIGTAFEIGYAIALRKPVFGWSPVNTTTYTERVKDMGIADEMIVEDHEMYDNLMVAVPLFDGTVHPSFERAAKAASNYFIDRENPPHT